jgi:phospholipase C
VVDHRAYQIGEQPITGLPNAPFALHTPDGEPLPHGVVTRDLVHRVLREPAADQRWQERWLRRLGRHRRDGDGSLRDSAVNLRLWQLAEQYTLCDNFFMGAFGGSFLNHQYLAAAQPPFYPNATRARPIPARR